MRNGRGWNRPFDRISSGIYENAVRLHWREHQQYRREHPQMVRLAMALQFREKLADLKEQIAQRRVMPTPAPVAIGCDSPSILAA